MKPAGHTGQGSVIWSSATHSGTSRVRIGLGRVGSDDPGDEERSWAGPLNNANNNQQEQLVFVVKAKTDVIGRRPAIDQVSSNGRENISPTSTRPAK